MIIVFARAPVPGQAKTRLIPRLGEWGAARLHLRLLRHALRTARAANFGPVELHLTRRHSLFRGAQLQRGRDLGERMHYALSRASGSVILIGSDCPALTPADLRRAARWLRGGCEVVLAPAEDGGYALVAVRKSLPELFLNMRWGERGVYAETLRRLQGRRWRALRMLWDVDRPEDLGRLRWPRLLSAARQAARR